MSGRVQKESADDSDRVDDAVDPRVQVSAARVCVARTEPRDTGTRGGGGEGSPRRIDTFVVGEKRPRHGWTVRKKSRRAMRSNGDFHRGSRRATPIPIFPCVSYLFPSPLRPLGRSPTHAYTHES